MSSKQRLSVASIIYRAHKMPVTSSFWLSAHHSRDSNVISFVKWISVLSAFEIEGPWLRDEYKCVNCQSIPRWPALMLVVAELYPKWRELKIHESFPG